MKMDAKFIGQIQKVKDGTVVPEDQWVCFLVKDNAFYRILPEYLKACEDLGADQEQLDAVKRVIIRATNWRKRNPQLCKTPDAAGERLLDKMGVIKEPEEGGGSNATSA